MFFSDDDLHEAMRTSLETLMRISVEERDVAHRASAAMALANLVLNIYDRRQDRDGDADGGLLMEEDEDDDEPAAQ